MAINTRKKSANDLSHSNVGSELTNISLKLARNKWSKYAMAWTAIFMSIFAISVMCMPMITDGFTANMISKHYKLTYITGDKPRVFYVADVDGSPIQLYKTVDGHKVIEMTRLDALDIVDSQIKKKFLSPLLFNWYFIWSIIGMAIATFAVFRLHAFFEKSGAAQIDDEFSRGVQLITEADYKKQLVENGEDGSEIMIADLPLPMSGERLGMLFYGNAGVGKSNISFDLMDQIFKQKRKSVIYTRTGEEFEMYFRPGIDVLFAPAYKGSVKWSLFSDMKIATDGAKLADAFLPSKSGDFFEIAARVVFAKVLLALYKRGETRSSAIAEEIYKLDDAAIDNLLKGTSAYNVIGKDKQRDGVLASVNIHLEALEHVADGSFSLREWIRRDDDSRLFLMGMKETEKTFMSMNRIALDIILAEIAIMNVKHSSGKYWFFIDEMPTLEFGQSNCIESALNEMRKYGVCVAASIQSERQLYNSAGENSAKILLNAFQTTVALRVTDGDTQKSVAQRLGDADIVQKSANANLAVNADRDGAGTNAQLTQDVFVVKPSEFSKLKSNTGYIRFVGYDPIFIDIRAWGPAGRMNRVGSNAIELCDSLTLIVDKPVHVPEPEIVAEIAELVADPADSVINAAPVTGSLNESEGFW